MLACNRKPAILGPPPTPRRPWACQDVPVLPSECLALAARKRRTSSSDEQWPLGLESRGQPEGPAGVFGSSEHAEPAVKDISGAEKALEARAWPQLSP